jgi:hypothetical protein
MIKFNEPCLEKKTLLTKFYEQVKGNAILNKQNLLKYVKNTCDETKSIDGFPINNIRGLRFLSKFDWNEIDKKYFYLTENLKNLYAETKINSELYYVKQAEDFYFYMVKVTGKNAYTWKEYALKQRSLSENYQGSDISIKKADKGIKGFLPSLDCHDQNFTETWVAFVSNKPWVDRNKIDCAAVEMFVSMMTSEHAYFTGHVGITRSISYDGIKHEDLACTLHTFIAQATLKRYKYKEYTINVPASRMREILVKKFINKGKFLDIYIGDDTSDIFLGDKLIQYDIESLDSLLKKRETMKLLGEDRLDHMLSSYEENELLISLIMQKKYLEEGKASMPLKIQKQPGSNIISSFALFSQNGKKLNDLTPQEMSGEFAWFFETPWFVKNLRQPLLTVNLRAMANLISFNNPIKHEAMTEIIGNTEIL